MTNNTHRFYGNHLDWPIARSTWPFRAFVVEPARYECTGAGHGDIFEAALNSLISPQSDLVDDYKKNNSPPRQEPFDLITFPEAFLPANRLLSTLKLFARSDLQGCIHVGLRPSADEDRHLFGIDELRSFIEDLKTLDDPIEHDLAQFETWLDVQREELKFNVGCLFTLDAAGKVRVCLHPKLVRSKFEYNALAEEHMEEANLLTVVTLRPVDKQLFTINIQPLLCSDALKLPTDRPGNTPLEAIHEHAECLGKTPPEHIDIVSVATCTPQKEITFAGSSRYRVWHGDFTDTFYRAASSGDLARHHFSVFILSNFRTVPKALPGGLSGAFIPRKPGKFLGDSRKLDFVFVSQWGKPDADAEEVAQGANNRWSTPNDAATAWSGLNYIASLNSFSNGAENAVARMFGFELPRLPRHMPSPQLALVKCKQKIANAKQGSEPLTFMSAGG